MYLKISTIFTLKLISLMNSISSNWVHWWTLQITLVFSLKSFAPQKKPLPLSVSRGITDWDDCRHILQVRFNYKIPIIKESGAEGAVEQFVLKIHKGSTVSCHCLDFQCSAFNTTSQSQPFHLSIPHVLLIRGKEELVKSDS